MNNVHLMQYYTTTVCCIISHMTTNKKHSLLKTIITKIQMFD